MRLGRGDQIALKRRWWVAVTMLTGYGVVVACAVWLSVTLPGEGQIAIRLLLILGMLAGCGFMALNVIRDFWIRLDFEGVWQPTLRGWRGIRWHEVIRAQAGRERIVLDSASRSIAINAAAFSQRDKLLHVLRKSLPPHATRKLESD